MSWYDALQLGRLARLESWIRVCAPMDPEELAEWGDAVPGWAMTLVDET